ncbi:hypothetical protein LLG95_17270 [bacterium]|nr:hypothetical protein [bacterium]
MNQKTAPKRKYELLTDFLMVLGVYGIGIMTRRYMYGDPIGIQLGDIGLYIMMIGTFYLIHVVAKRNGPSGDSAGQKK